MPKFVGHGPDAAEASDNRPDAHSPVVRVEGTMSRVEPVQRFERYAPVMGQADTETVGNKMRALRARAGMSLGEVATALGRPRSSIQKFFEVDYRPGGLLDLEDAITFIGLFCGRGKPPITHDDLMNLTALPMAPQRQEGGPSPLPRQVALVMARSFAMIAQGGREPTEDVTEALGRMIQELSLLHQRDPAMRSDAGRTQGALDLLTLQLSRPRNELQ
jgi:hypothetical protein